jgi:hypothetical protein
MDVGSMVSMMKKHTKKGEKAGKRRGGGDEGKSCFYCLVPSLFLFPEVNSETPRPSHINSNDSDNNGL